MKIRKLLSILLIAVLILTLLPTAVVVFAHDDTGEREEYLVVAKNQITYNVIENEYTKMQSFTPYRF